MPNIIDVDSSMSLKDTNPEASGAEIVVDVNPEASGAEIIIDNPQVAPVQEAQSHVAPVQEAKPESKGSWLSSFW